jgi:predicted dehydrogenase
MPDSNSSSYRLAIIGCGKRAREHMVGVLADKRIQICSLADTIPESATQFAADFSLDVPVYSQYQELLEKEKPDVVIVTLWTNLHLPVFRDCAAAGVKAVLSEKPMSARWNECREMARIAEESGCILTFCHQRRFASGNLLARELIRDGRFGTIQRMDLFSFRHLLDCGTHTVDQALSFNNETPANWVQGVVDISETIEWFDVRAESMALGFIHFDNGVQATFRVGSRDMDMWSGVRIFGDKGFLEVGWDGDYRHCHIYNEPDWKPPVVEALPGEQMIGVIKNAIDCLETGEEPELSYRKALRASEILFALYESARRRSEVELPINPNIGNPLFDLLDHPQG